MTTNSTVLITSSSIGSGFWDYNNTEQQQQEQQQQHQANNNNCNKNKNNNSKNILITFSPNNRLISRSCRKNESCSSSVRYVTKTKSTSTVSSSSTTTTTSNSDFKNNNNSNNNNNNHNEKNDDTNNDKSLIELAEQAYENNKVLEAFRLLGQVQNQEAFFGTKHYKIIQVAKECQYMVSDLLDIHNIDKIVKQQTHTTKNTSTTNSNSNRSSWIKHGESHGKFNTNVYYKYPDQDGPSTIVCRLETPIEVSLLIPLLSVLNETNLYTTWLPKFKKAGIGCQIAQSLYTFERVNQIVYWLGGLPWPFASRELIIKAICVDEIDYHNNNDINDKNNNDNYYIAITLHNYNTNQDTTNTDSNDDNTYNTNTECITIPKYKDGTTTKPVRADLEGAFVFRPCPSDHPLLLPRDKNNCNNQNVYNNNYNHDHNNTELYDDNDDDDLPSITTAAITENTYNNEKSSEQYIKNRNKNSNDNNNTEPMILVSFKVSINTHMFGIPKSLINFVFRYAIGGMWRMLLNVAEQVHLGLLPAHAEAIASKPEIYQYIQDRANKMIHRLHQEQKINTTAAEERK